jgi:hypothetical protein
MIPVTMRCWLGIIMVLCWAVPQVQAAPDARVRELRVQIRVFPDGRRSVRTRKEVEVVSLHARSQLGDPRIPWNEGGQTLRIHESRVLLPSGEELALPEYAFNRATPLAVMEAPIFGPWTETIVSMPGLVTGAVWVLDWEILDLAPGDYAEGLIPIGDGLAVDSGLIELTVPASLPLTREVLFPHASIRKGSTDHAAADTTYRYEVESLPECTARPEEWAVACPVLAFSTARDWGTVVKPWHDWLQQEIATAAKLPTGIAPPWTADAGALASVLEVLRWLKPRMRVADVRADGFPMPRPLSDVLASRQGSRLEVALAVSALLSARTIQNRVVLASAFAAPSVHRTDGALERSGPAFEWLPPMRGILSDAYLLVGLPGVTLLVDVKSLSLVARPATPWNHPALVLPPGFESRDRHPPSLATLEQMLHPSGRTHVVVHADLSAPEGKLTVTLDSEGTTSVWYRFQEGADMAALGAWAASQLGLSVQWSSLDVVQWQPFATSFVLRGTLPETAHRGMFSLPGFFMDMGGWQQVSKRPWPRDEAPSVPLGGNWVYSGEYVLLGPQSWEVAPGPDTLLRGDSIQFKRSVTVEPGRVREVQHAEFRGRPGRVLGPSDQDLVNRIRCALELPVVVFPAPGSASQEPSTP